MTVEIVRQNRFWKKLYLLLPIFWTTIQLKVYMMLLQRKHG